MIPYRGHTIIGIIALAAFVYAGEQLRGTSFAESHGAVPSIIVQAFQELSRGNFSLDAIQSLTRLVTPLFLHGDVEHIALNMVFLWAFGYLTARILGPWWAVGVFIFCGVCGNILQVWLNPASTIPIIGASGAVCGFEGVYLGLALRWNLPWPDVWPLAHPIPPLQLGAFAVVGFLIDVVMVANQGQQIAYGAHIGGFLSGLAVAAIVTLIYPAAASWQQPHRR